MLVNQKKPRLEYDFLMKKIIFIIAFLLAKYMVAQKSNPAPSLSVIDEYFGNKIVDEYRNLENLKNLSTIKWMKSQTDFAISIINKIPNKNFYLNQRLELDKRQGFSVSDLSITSNDKYFYLKTNAGEKSAKVYYRNGFNGKEEILYDPANFSSSIKNTTEKSKHRFVINLLSPSWDGAN